LFINKRGAHRRELGDLVDVGLVIPLGEDVAGALLVAEFVDLLQQGGHVDAAEFVLLLVLGPQFEPLAAEVAPRVGVVEGRQVELGAREAPAEEKHQEEHQRVLRASHGARLTQRAPLSSVPRRR